MNNAEGLPLAILRRGWLTKGGPLVRIRGLAGSLVRTGRTLLGRYPDIVILEMGTSAPGMLNKIVTLARPDIGVLTTVGPSHLDKLGTINGVFQEKLTVLRAVPKDGLVITGDLPAFAAEIENAVSAPVVVAHGEGLDLAKSIAHVIGKYLGADDEALLEAADAVEPPEGRLSRVSVGSISIIDDSYNANPMSMKHGLKYLAEQRSSGGRSVAVLADMMDLGQDTQRYHEEIAVPAHEAADVLVGVGHLARYYEPQHWFANAEDCANEIGRIIAPGDIVFVKGSNGMELGKVVERIGEDVE